MSDNDFTQWVAKLPKAELHIHIDGSLQAARMLSLAKKNNVSLPYKTEADISAAYNFVDLQSFLDLYYLGASVLRDEEDFYHLMMDYLIRCREENVLHTEIMVEPQTYFPYDVSFATMMNGFLAAINEAEKEWGQSVGLILSVLRHLSEQEAIATLIAAEPYREHFVAVGIASSESGNPPEKFTEFYRLAKERGYMRTAHAGEEGPAEYIWNSLDVLDVQRIDHGVRCVEDEKLVTHLIDKKIPLTVCPLSNIKLCVFDNMTQHNILQLLDRGVMVTINSDDPTYFGGFLNDNFVALHNDLQLNKAQAIQLAKNSFNASFLPQVKKDLFVQRINQYEAE